MAERRGRAIGRVAAARKLLTLVYYGLRDGEIRCLAETGETIRRGRTRVRCLSWPVEAERLIEPVRLRPHHSMPLALAKR